MSTWHYGVISEWWANFNLDGGRELAYYGPHIETGQPALDAGCGAGRLLVPWLRAGFDVDGCDVSADMVERCRERLAAEGLDATLFVQPLHALEPPRRYRTIVVCGVFGLGSTRTQDADALDRLHSSIEPGGTLLLDIEVPWAHPGLFARWTAERREELPGPWPQEPDRKTTADGTEYSLWNRTLAADPLDQSHVLQIRAEKRRGGEVLAEEERTLTMRSYFPDQLVLMLKRAGFADVTVEGGYEHRPPTPDDDFLVFVGRQ